MISPEQRRAVVVEYCTDTVISSAQNLEDVLIFRAFRGQRSGFYCDIGAGDPNWDSVTNWFYRIGWRGLNIEPNPTLFTTIQEWRPDEINLNIGIADTPGELTYYQVIQNQLGAGWGLSSFVPDIQDIAARQGFEVRRRKIAVQPLQSVIDTYCRDQPIDFLKIDVEGFEEKIILSTDWRRVRPQLLCIESVDLLSQPTFAAWEPHLLKAGYEFALFDGINSFYAPEERFDVLAQLNAPANSRDRYRKATAEDFVLGPQAGAEIAPTSGP